MVEVRQYVSLSGRNVFERWFFALDPATAARVESSLARLEEGNFSGVKGVGAGVFEMRLFFGPGYRIYFGKDGEQLVILLAGGSKKETAPRHTDCCKKSGKNIKLGRRRAMALTKSFRDTVVARTQADAAFRKELLYHALELMLAGDVQTGKRVLRNYINATVGFPKLAEALDLSPKGVQRMFSSTGNPQAKNLFKIVAFLQTVEGVQLTVRDVA